MLGKGSSTCECSEEWRRGRERSVSHSAGGSEEGRAGARRDLGHQGTGADQGVMFWKGTVAEAAVRGVDGGELDLRSSARRPDPEAWISGWRIQRESEKDL